MASSWASDSALVHHTFEKATSTRKLVSSFSPLQSRFFRIVETCARRTLTLVKRCFSLTFAILTRGIASVSAGASLLSLGSVILDAFSPRSFLGLLGEFLVQYPLGQPRKRCEHHCERVDRSRWCPMYSSNCKTVFLYAILVFNESSPAVTVSKMFPAFALRLVQRPFAPFCCETQVKYVS